MALNLLPMNRFAALREAAHGAREGFARRAALARQPRPDGVSGPPLKYLLGELGTFADRLRPSAVAAEQAAKPRPVMLLPGFGTHPRRMWRMHRALAGAGHAVYDWGLGFNLGPTPQNFAFLLSRVSKLARRHREPVALVGWSLGGLFAREIAKQRPEAVSAVITMGSPFSGDLRANNAWRVYEVVAGHAVDRPPIECDFTTKPPVPTIALWSPRDGIVAPRSARGRPDERDREVALRCSHIGFAADPRAIREVLRQLDMLG